MGKKETEQVELFSWSYREHEGDNGNINSAKVKQVTSKRNFDEKGKPECNLEVI